MENPISALSGDPVLAYTSVRDREELAYKILASLPRSSIAVVQRRITPLLQLDVVGLLPDEVALLVFSYLPYQSLLTCCLVSRRWRALADDQSLWKNLCAARGWRWKTPMNPFRIPDTQNCDYYDDSDDEGMGDEEDSMEAVQHMLLPDDIDHSPFRVRSSSPDTPSTPATAVQSQSLYIPGGAHDYSGTASQHISACVSNSSIWPSSSLMKPDYKLLHQTHIRLRNRMLSASCTLSSLQTRGSSNGHTNTIYCLQLYTYPETGVQVLFTGSKDHTVREWDLRTGGVVRVIDGIHESSVLSISVNNGLLASGGSDRRVAVWDLTKNELVKIIDDHLDSVLCVRFDDEGRRLVTCSKDRTVRTYLLPHIIPQQVLCDHRAAVNAVSISPTHIVSASGDRSMRLWDAETGTLLRTFENHHGRGIASIDFKPPFILSGSSDKHLRLLDISTSQGWSTSPELDTRATVPSLAPAGICESCGTGTGIADRLGTLGRQRAHEDLVRSVALNTDFVVSGSYDFTVKLWDRQTGALVADLAGGHTGRIFCVGFDCTKIVSCGEDQRICIWDFSHGIDTSFITL
ncbi:WD40 repeat-like protein [Obba rivulosa]|uniref:WD40 repeat-like protein n=1 Tax=Obba rivulosa TaxID=1052685 RepID=A0A8E2B477_9APHY|nr:WD40 repeat-like protein [Obba rivulosa]